MKKSKRMNFVQGLGLILVSLSASCQLVDNGEFKGNLTRNSSSRDAEKNLQSEMLPVRILLKKNDRVLTVSVKSEDGALVTELTFKLPKFSVFKPKAFKVTIPDLSDKPIRLRRKDHCFVSEGIPRVDVCFERGGFFVTALGADDIPLFVLTADPVNNFQSESLEENVTIKLSDAITMALKRNFKNRLEVEHVFQAKKGAEEAYKNLAPHIGMKTAISLLESVGGNPVDMVLGLLGSVGDLAPFLLPNRWFQAKEADSIHQAQDLSLVLMELNLIAQVEGLAYIFERDRKNLLVLDQMIEWLGEKERVLKS